MKYTKQHRNTSSSQREQTWEKYKKQANQLSAHKRNGQRNGR